MFDLAVINSKGYITVDNVYPSEMTGKQFKHKALETMELLNQLDYFCTNKDKLSNKYVLIHIRSQQLLNEHLTLQESGILNNG